jgi:hypothetical protein
MSIQGAAALLPLTALSVLSSIACKSRRVSPYLVVWELVDGTHQRGRTLQEFEFAA